MTNFITMQVANGNAFFVGLIVVTVAALCSLATERRVWKVWTRISAVIGATFIVVSATPLSIWVYILWFVLFVFTFAPKKKFLSRRGVGAATLVLVLLSAIMSLHELSYRRAPVVRVNRAQTVYVIGDSISAGIREEKKPWPIVLRDRYRLEVVNLSQAGATTESALLQAQQIRRPNSLVIVEIGGNDFLGATKSSGFESNLQILLAALASQRHTITMFELPLFPFHNGFGSAQRLLAHKYGVVLLPKTYLAGILSAPGATIDGLHLSQSGHDAMAKLVYDTLHIEETVLK
jgi:acyl-CoA thioesterase-1